MCDRTESLQEMLSFGESVAGLVAILSFLQGMSAVKMYIQPSDENSIPVAHTCFNLLDLPNISDREEMRRRLLICLENTQGFNLV